MAEQSFSVAGTSSTAATAHKTKVEPDVIIVLLAAEKKGIFLKHSEYEVSKEGGIIWQFKMRFKIDKI